MKVDSHPYNLGLLLSNFQSLEFALRAFLQNLPDAAPLGIPHGVDIYTCPVGTDLPINAFTNYDSLSDLLKKYNAEMRKAGGSLIDESLIDLRDALAHGRVAMRGDNVDHHLVKFSRPVDNKVRVTFNEEMTTIWFKANVDRVSAAIRSVAHQLGSHKSAPSDALRSAGSGGG